MPFLEIRGLAKTYPGGAVGLHGFELALERGERLALLGPSGSGKSTLLRLLCGLEEPDRGEIILDGQRIDRLPPQKRGIAFVPQRPVLFPHLSVKQNLEVAVANKSTPPPGPLPEAERGSSSSNTLRFGEGGERNEPGGVKSIPFAEAVALLRIEHHLHKAPDELSGGERQRVALAKVLLRDAALWLLDEPFSNLDAPFRAEFRHELHLLLERTSATMILVTHDSADAWALGRTHGVLNGGQLLQVGEPRELRSNPLHSFVAFSLGSFQRIDGFVQWNDSAAQKRGEAPSEGDAGVPVFVSECGSIRIPVPPAIARGLGKESAPPMAFGIKPEDVIARLPGSLPPPCEVPVELRGWLPVSAEPAGSGWLLTVARGRTRLRTEWRTASPPPVGTPLDWVIAAERGLWFNGRTGARL